MIENIPNEFSKDITVLQKVTITWHQYPQEKPTDGLDVIVITEGKIKPYLYIAYLSDGKFLIRGHKDMSVVDVYAWSEIPKPYDGGINERN